MKPERFPWKLVITLCSTATAAYICRVNVSTAGVLLKQEFQLSPVQMGYIFSAFLLGYAIFQIPGGILADRLGPKKLLTYCSGLWFVLSVLQTLAGTKLVFVENATAALAFFIICRFLLGVSASPTYPTSARGVSLWVLPRFQGRANGVVIASIGLGSAIAPPLISYIMVHWGWRMAVIASAVPALLMAIVWVQTKTPELHPVRSQNPENHSSHIQGDLLSRDFVLLTISYSLQGYVGYIFVSWFYMYLVNIRHFNLLTGAWLSSLSWALSIFSIAFGGWLSDILSAGKAGPVWGRRLIPLIGMTAAGGLISIGARTENALLAAVTLSVATSLVLCVEGPFWTMMLKIAGTRSGAAGGIMNTGSNVGGLISPVLTPFIASYLGWENALHVAAALSIIAAALWLWIGRRSAAI